MMGAGIMQDDGRKECFKCAHDRSVREGRTGKAREAAGPGQH